MQKCKSLKQNFNKTIYSLRQSQSMAIEERKELQYEVMEKFWEKINRTEFAHVVIFLLAQWSCSVNALPC